MNKALAFAFALISPALAAAPASLRVWIPEQGQTGTLSAAGLVAADGGRVALNRPQTDLTTEQPIAGGFARFIPVGKANPARLEVVRSGRVRAARTFPKVLNGGGLQGTKRGPCLSYRATGGQEVTARCFTSDLKTEWDSLPGSFFVGASGKVAYLVKTDWKLQKPAGDDVEVVRRDLGTGQQVSLSYRVPLPGQTLVLAPGMVDPLDRRATLPYSSPTARRALSDLRQYHYSQRPLPPGRG